MHTLVGILDQREGLLAEAEAHLESVRALCPSASDQRPWLVKFYVATGGASRKAVECFLAYLRHPPEAGRATPPEEVLEATRTACQVRPEMTPAELTERVKGTQDVQKLLPDETWPKINEGRAWNRLGRNDRARRVLDEVLAQHPDAWQARVWLARVLVALGQPDRAKEELAVLLKQRPDDAEVLLWVAAQQGVIGDLGTTKKLLDRVSRTHPELFGRVRAVTAMIYIRIKQPGKAIRPLEEALAEDPTDARIALLLAEASSLGTTLLAGKKAVSPELVVGSLLANEGEHERALPYLEKGLPRGKDRVRVPTCFARSACAPLPTTARRRNSDVLPRS
ncbi:MAG TPA: tetratricopeptide repeat protein [Gemmataceae bacterium]|nr:tetratricopeptide repeat protein [Gemmataceae bacterium]